MLQGLMDCTNLRRLTVIARSRSGANCPPMPSGAYKERLEALTWSGRHIIRFPRALAAARRLVHLNINVYLLAILDCIAAVSAMPELRELHCRRGKDDMYMVNTVLELQRQIPSVTFRCHVVFDRLSGDDADEAGDGND